MIHDPKNDIRCEAEGPTPNGKYFGVIELWRNSNLHVLLASTQPIYASEDEAKAAMRKIVVSIRSMPASTFEKIMEVKP